MQLNLLFKQVFLLIPFNLHEKTIGPIFIYANLFVTAQFASAPQFNYRRERWELADGDFIDTDWVEPKTITSSQPIVVLFHGLEGGSQSPYAKSVDGSYPRQKLAWLYILEAAQVTQIGCHANAISST